MNRIRIYLILAFLGLATAQAGSLDEVVKNLGGFVEGYQIAESTAVVRLNSTAWDALTKDQQIRILDTLGGKAVWKEAGLTTVHVKVDATEVGSFESFGGWHFKPNKSYWSLR